MKNWIAAGMLLWGAAAQLLACPHTPPDYCCAVKETTKEAIIWHDGELAHLVVKTGFSSSGPFPKTMAWVIPLPSLPVDYAEAEADVFQKLYDWYNGATMPRSAGPLMKSAPPLAAAAILEHAPVMVGAYVINPVEIVSESAGDELNQWLKKNGLAEVPAHLQKHYLHKGAAFLAIRLNNQKGREIRLKPLHIRYKSPKAVLPLKFSSGSGVFDLVFYALSSSKGGLPDARDYKMEGGLPVKIEPDDYGACPSGLDKLLGSCEGNWVARYVAHGFNDAHNRVLLLKEDPWVATPVKKVKKS